MPGAFDCGERARNEFAEKQRVRLYIETCAPTPRCRSNLRDSRAPDAFHAVAFWTRTEPRCGCASSASRDAFRALSLNHLNLSLAARPCVGHIGLNGDVAEWLKAAVC